MESSSSLSLSSTGNDAGGHLESNKEINNVLSSKIGGGNKLAEIALAVEIHDDQPHDSNHRKTNSISYPSNKLKNTIFATSPRGINEVPRDQINYSQTEQFNIIPNSRMDESLNVRFANKLSHQNFSKVSNDLSLTHIPIEAQLELLKHQHLPRLVSFRTSRVPPQTRSDEYFSMDTSSYTDNDLKNNSFGDGNKVLNSNTIHLVPNSQADSNFRIEQIDGYSISQWDATIDTSRFFLTKCTSKTISDYSSVSFKEDTVVIPSSMTAHVKKKSDIKMGASSNEIEDFPKGNLKLNALLPISPKNFTTKKDIANSTATKSNLSISVTSRDGDCSPAKCFLEMSKERSVETSLTKLGVGKNDNIKLKLPTSSLDQIANQLNKVRDTTSSEIPTDFSQPHTGNILEVNLFEVQSIEASSNELQVVDKKDNLKLELPTSITSKESFGLAVTANKDVVNPYKSGSGSHDLFPNIQSIVNPMIEGTYSVAGDCPQPQCLSEMNKLKPSETKSNESNGVFKQLFSNIGTSKNPLTTRRMPVLNAPLNFLKSSFEKTTSIVAKSESTPRARSEIFTSFLSGLTSPASEQTIKQGKQGPLALNAVMRPQASLEMPSSSAKTEAKTVLGDVNGIRLRAPEVNGKLESIKAGKNTVAPLSILNAIESTLNSLETYSAEITKIHSNERLCLAKIAGVDILESHAMVDNSSILKGECLEIFVDGRKKEFARKESISPRSNSGKHTVFLPGITSTTKQPLKNNKGTFAKTESEDPILKTSLTSNKMDGSQPLLASDITANYENNYPLSNTVPNKPIVLNAPKLQDTSSIKIRTTHSVELFLGTTAGDLVQYQTRINGTKVKCFTKSTHQNSDTKTVDGSKKVYRSKESISPCSNPETPNTTQSLKIEKQVHVSSVKTRFEVPCLEVAFIPELTPAVGGSLCASEIPIKFGNRDPHTNIDSNQSIELNPSKLTLNSPDKSTTRIGTTGTRKGELSLEILDERGLVQFSDANVISVSEIKECSKSEKKNDAQIVNHVNKICVDKASVSLCLDSETHTEHFEMTTNTTEPLEIHKQASIKAKFEVTDLKSTFAPKSTPSIGASAIPNKFRNNEDPRTNIVPIKSVELNPSMTTPLNSPDEFTTRIGTSVLVGELFLGTLDESVTTQSDGLINSSISKDNRCSKPLDKSIAKTVDDSYTKYDDKETISPRPHPETHSDVHFDASTTQPLRNDNEVPTKFKSRVTDVETPSTSDIVSIYGGRVHGTETMSKLENDSSLKTKVEIKSIAINVEKETISNSKTEISGSGIEHQQHMDLSHKSLDQEQTIIKALSLKTGASNNCITNSILARATSLAEIHEFNDVVTSEPETVAQLEPFPESLHSLGNDQSCSKKLAAKITISNNPHIANIVSSRIEEILTRFGLPKKSIHLETIVSFYYNCKILLLKEDLRDIHFSVSDLKAHLVFNDNMKKLQYLTKILYTVLFRRIWINFRGGNDAHLAYEKRYSSFNQENNISHVYNHNRKSLELAKIFPFLVFDDLKHVQDIISICNVSQSSCKNVNTFHKNANRPSKDDVIFFIAWIKSQYPSSNNETALKTDLFSDRQDSSDSSITEATEVKADSKFISETINITLETNKNTRLQNLNSLLSKPNSSTGTDPLAIASYDLREISQNETEYQSGKQLAKHKFEEDEIPQVNERPVKKQFASLTVELTVTPTVSSKNTPQLTGILTARTDMNTTGNSMVIGKSLRGANSQQPPSSVIQQQVLIDKGTSNISTQGMIVPITQQDESRKRKDMDLPRLRNNDLKTGTSSTRTSTVGSTTPSSTQSDSISKINELKVPNGVSYDEPRYSSRPIHEDSPRETNSSGNSLQTGRSKFIKSTVIIPFKDLDNSKSRPRDRNFDQQVYFVHTERPPDSSQGRRARKRQRR